MIDDWAFYFITDDRLTSQGVLYDISRALEGGARVIQIRPVKTGDRELYITALRARALTRTTGADLIVNNRLDIALAVEADGVHLGQNDLPLEVARKLMPRGIIGISVDSPEMARRAENAGADYIGAGPIFDTTTKANAGAGRGLELIAEVKRAVNIHVTAIGGIDMERLDTVLSHGADSACAISATVGVGDVAGAVKAFETRIRAERSR